MSKTKIKLPLKKVWVGLSSESKRCYRVYEHDPDLTYAKPYYLHTSNEVATALNLLNKQFAFGPLAGLEARSRTGIAFILEQAGFKIRWDNRRGRFV